MVGQPKDEQYKGDARNVGTKGGGSVAHMR